jgi:hypothetical protein
LSSIVRLKSNYFLDETFIDEERQIIAATYIAILVYFSIAQSVGWQYISAIYSIGVPVYEAADWKTKEIDKGVFGLSEPRQRKSKVRPISHHFFESESYTSLSFAACPAKSLCVRTVRSVKSMARAVFHLQILVVWSRAGRQTHGSK